MSPWLSVAAHFPQRPENMDPVSSQEQTLQDIQESPMSASYHYCREKHVGFQALFIGK
jgi:hypothetical protein